MSEAAAQQKIRTPAELVALVEALIFVADEPITTSLLAEVLEEDKRERSRPRSRNYHDEYESREGGLQIREIAGGWQLSHADRASRRSPQVP